MLNFLVYLKLCDYAWSVMKWYVFFHSKHKYLLNHFANLDQILYVAVLGWDNLTSLSFETDQNKNYGYHGNIKVQLTYNGENVVWA